ncbi:hypothetical protein I4F81_012069 [Pyropia yezoensis]|uniref:Uncharacterized protein n=1 Tax=Pyropia yezoensis TaxID=2788 RepID=A0ACC3CH59_PYRYE|nr:hypothetical protein I4F81_012069 [Neopyropia yezoensis]
MVLVMLLHVGLILYDRYYARRQLRLAEAVSTLPFPPPAAHESPAVTAASRAREDALAALPTRRGGAPPVASPPLDGAADVAVVAAAALALSLDCGSGGEAVDEAADGAGRPGDAGGSPAGAPPTCAVCMGDLDAAEEVVVLPCGHVFHSGPTGADGDATPAAGQLAAPLEGAPPPSAAAAAAPTVPASSRHRPTAQPAGAPTPAAAPPARAAGSRRPPTASSPRAERRLARRERRRARRLAAPAGSHRPLSFVALEWLEAL